MTLYNVDIIDSLHEYKNKVDSLQASGHHISLINFVGEKGKAFWVITWIRNEKEKVESKLQ